MKNLFWFLEGFQYYCLNAATNPIEGRPIIRNMPNICPVAFAEFAFWYQSRVFSSDCTVFLQVGLSPHDFIFATSSRIILAISDWSGTLTYTACVIKSTTIPEIREEPMIPTNAKLTIIVLIFVSYKDQVIKKSPTFVFLMKT